MKNILLILFCLLLSGCLGVPEKVTPVDNFDVNRYLGTWYEIARLDHSFERGLTNVTAEYSLRDDGGIKVVNRGYSAENEAWKEAEGRAYFVENERQGYLKVSFFGPFYGSYVIFGLDREAYQYSFVSGPDTSYLWLLARSPDLDSKIVRQFVLDAQSRGFDTEQLIFVEHDSIVPPPIEPTAN